MYALLLTPLQPGVPKPLEQKTVPFMPGPAVHMGRLCKASCDTGQHGLAAWPRDTALCHLERGKHMEKEERSVPRGEHMLASTQIQQPSAKAAPALCSARGLGSCLVRLEAKRKSK